MEREKLIAAHRKYSDDFEESDYATGTPRREQKERVKDGSSGKDYKQRLLSLKGKPEGTYDINTGEKVSFKTGYQFSFQQTGDTYTSSEYDSIVGEIIQRTESKVYGGVYGEPEVSFHTEERETAMIIAAKYNQESVLDWEAASRDDWDNAHSYEKNDIILKKAIKLKGENKMQAQDVKTNKDLIQFLDAFKTNKERGDFMRGADNALIDHFISLSNCVLPQKCG